MQPGAGMISDSGMPWVSAAASTNGLNAEPVPRPFSAGSGLHPIARLHFAVGCDPKKSRPPTMART